MESPMTVLHAKIKLIHFLLSNPATMMVSAQLFFQSLTRRERDEAEAASKGGSQEGGRGAMSGLVHSSS